ncbi:MAG: hypothetical protein OEZ34_15255 [Spirochaetia bacterium]|nr:hypothetical protein [Spirochaetia bacterium]
MKHPLPLYNFLMMILMGALLPLAFLMAFLYYRELTDTVIKGFDEKLIFSTEISRKLIDPKLHKDLYSYRQAGSLAFDKKNFYAVENLGGRILKSDSPSGEFHPAGSFDVDVHDVTVYKGNLAGSVQGENKIRILNPDLLDADEPFDLMMPHECFGLAYDRKQNVFYCSGESAISILEETGQITSRLPSDLNFEGGMRSLIVRNSILYALLSEEEGRAKIIQFSPGAKKAKEIPVAMDDLPLGFEFHKNGFSVSSTRSLYLISESGKITGQFAPVASGNKETARFYAKTGRMLETIRKHSDLTYLYTFFLSDDRRYIQYTIDSTQDIYHSLSGSVDSTPVEEGIRDVWFKGESYVSGIKFWEEWGLLKSGYSPLNYNQETAGIVGADVNISVIDKRKKTVLTWVILSTIALLFTALVLLRMMTKSFLRPIKDLHEIILQIASGKLSETHHFNIHGNLKPIQKKLEEIRSEIEFQNTIYKRDSGIIKNK